MTARLSSRVNWQQAHQLLWPILLMLALAMGVEWTSIDRWITSLFFNSATQTFPLNQHFLFKQVLHDWGRNLAYLTALVTLLTLIYSWIFKIPQWRPPLLFILLSMVASTATIALMKYNSTIHCPNNLLEYGGNFATIELFSFGNSEQAAGKCWPSGHASTGFCLIALFYAARAYAPRWALASLCLALLLGFSFSLAQTARGVHFFSHGLWTALFIWSINILLSCVMLPAKREMLPAKRVHL